MTSTAAVVVHDALYDQYSSSGSTVMMRCTAAVLLVVLVLALLYYCSTVMMRVHFYADEGKFTACVLAATVCFSVFFFGSPHINPLRHGGRTCSRTSRTGRERSARERERERGAMRNNKATAKAGVQRKTTFVTTIVTMMTMMTKVMMMIMIMMTMVMVMRMMKKKKRWKSTIVERIPLP